MAGSVSVQIMQSQQSHSMSSPYPASGGVNPSYVHDDFRRYRESPEEYGEQGRGRAGFEKEEFAMGSINKHSINSESVLRIQPEDHDSFMTQESNSDAGERKRKERSFDEIRERRQGPTIYRPIMLCPCFCDGRPLKTGKKEKRGIINPDVENSPSISRNERGEPDDQKPEYMKNRHKRFNIFTRLVSIVLIIADVVFDWMQFSEINNPLDDLIEAKEKLTESIKIKYFGKFGNESIKHCSGDNKYAKYYLYFTIAGTALACFQVGNIIYQIYHEIHHGKKIKKILDGRTEVLITYLFEEIPQMLLAAKFDSICSIACDLPSLSSKKKEKKIYSTLSHSVTFFSQSWRSLTSFTCCEHGPSSTSTSFCCGPKCFLLCCCPGFYYLYLMFNWILCIFGRKCVCHSKKCSPDIKRHEEPFQCCLCTVIWCPTNNHKWFNCNICRCGNDDDDSLAYEPCWCIIFLSQLLNFVYGFFFVLVTMSIMDCTAPFLIGELVNIIFEYLNI